MDFFYCEQTLNWISRVYLYVKIILTYFNFYCIVQFNYITYLCIVIINNLQ